MVKIAVEYQRERRNRDSLSVGVGGPHDGHKRRVALRTAGAGFEDAGHYCTALASTPSSAIRMSASPGRTCSRSDCNSA